MFFAIISTTVALIAVFMPIVFLQGLTGRLFKEFGIVIGGSVAISAFVALTLTPDAWARACSSRTRTTAPSIARTEPFFVRLTQGYRRSLDGVPARRRWRRPSS